MLHQVPNSRTNYSFIFQWLPEQILTIPATSILYWVQLHSTWKTLVNYFLCVYWKSTLTLVITNIVAIYFITMKCDLLLVSSVTKQFKGFEITPQLHHMTKDPSCFSVLDMTKYEKHNENECLYNCWLRENFIVNKHSNANSQILRNM